MQYRQDIQGIRAIAVVSVVLFHAWPNVIPGGFVGVDIFFVLSGFLITSILKKEAETGTFSLLEFYRRRIRRIIPALFTLLAVVICAGAVILSPADFRSLSRSTVATIFFASNIDSWKTTDYFATASQLRPILHTWSLAVEEQFYIAYPFLVLLLTKKAQRTRMITLWAIAAASLLLSAFLVERNPSAAYFLPQSRAFELLLGGIIAYAKPQNISRLRNEFASWAAVGMLAVAFFLYNESTAFPGIAALMPCVATCILLRARDGESMVSRALHCKLLQSLGGISYSYYLWHWPLLSFSHHLFGEQLPLWISAGAVIAALALAYASFRWVEQPFLSKRGADLPHFKITALTSAALLLIACSVYLKQGIPDRFDDRSAKAFSFSIDFNPRRPECHRGDGNNYSYSSSCTYGNDHPTIAVWGDSHGVELIAAMAREDRELKRGFLQLTYSACPPSIEFAGSGQACINHNNTVLSDLQSDTGIKTVILVSDAQSYHFSSDLIQGLKRTVSSLVSNGKEVVVINQIPDFNFDPPAAAGRAIAWGRDAEILGLPLSAYLASTKNWSEALKRLHLELAFREVDPTEVLCKSDFCPVYQREIGVLYFNRNHLSNTGALLLASSVLKTIDHHPYRDRGATIPRLPLPHHPACGSAPGGSRS